MALVRAHVGQWLVAGDFNITPHHELNATNILSEMRGHLLTVGEATTQGGSEIDFVITSYAISGLVEAELDWSAPHRPHASLHIQLTMPRNTVTSLRIPDFPVKDMGSSRNWAPFWVPIIPRQPYNKRTLTGDPKLEDYPKNRRPNCFAILPHGLAVSFLLDCEVLGCAGSYGLGPKP